MKTVRFGIVCVLLTCVMPAIGKTARPIRSMPKKWQATVQAGMAMDYFQGFVGEIGLHYRWIKNLSTEFSVEYYPRPEKIRPGLMDSRAFGMNLRLVYRVRLHDKLYIPVKVGWMRTTESSTYTSFPPAKYTSSYWGVSAGLGMEYDISGSFGIAGSGTFKYQFEGDKFPSWFLFSGGIFIRF